MGGKVVMQVIITRHNFLDRQDRFLYYLMKEVL